MTPSDASDDAIAAVALAEVRAPRLRTTAQFFSVHRLASQPIAGVWPEPGGWSVAMSLEGEPYFWVCRVERSSAGLRTVWGSHSNLAKVYLAISSDTVRPEDVTSQLGLQPYGTHIKGSPRQWNGITGRPYEDHRWYYRADCPEPLDFEAKLSRLLVDLSPRSEQLRDLAGRCAVVIQVAIYEYADSPRGWHLERGVLRNLAELGLELDVDLYVSGPALPE